ncbi:hypothetical protein [Tenacibaculum piscium]|jgi:hypothetical protein|uniref:hypothetical protein n=1 Tax=Tenacibaculum piscium TaxID=1458515 RepID=UPI001F37AA97|nr:hypothetical protein [Tenacibaculum piscium]
MVKEKFIRILSDTIDKNPKFTFADFTITQKKTTTRGIQTIVKIQYNYNDDYFMNINIPETRTSYKKNNYSEETYLDYEIECENSPGDIEMSEKNLVKGTNGVVSHLSSWLNLVWEEIIAIPINREFNNLKSSVEELYGQMKNVPDEEFSNEERIKYEKKLDNLEKKFTENLESQELEKKELEDKLSTLHSEIDGLKQTLKVFNKKNWFKSFGAKVLNWGAKPENQKMISNGAKIVKGFLGSGETPE